MQGKADVVLFIGIPLRRTIDYIDAHYKLLDKESGNIYDHQNL